MSLARAITSSSELNFWIAATAPKISSWATAMSGVMPVSTVGAKNLPLIFLVIILPIIAKTLIKISDAVNYHDQREHLLFS